MIAFTKTKGIYVAILTTLAGTVLADGSNLTPPNLSLFNDPLTGKTPEDGVFQNGTFKWDSIQNKWVPDTYTFTSNSNIGVIYPTINNIFGGNNHRPAQPEASAEVLTIGTGKDYVMVRTNQTVNPSITKSLSRQGIVNSVAQGDNIHPDRYARLVFDAPTYISLEGAVPMTSMGNQFTAGVIQHNPSQGSSGGSVKFKDLYIDATKLDLSNATAGNVHGVWEESKTTKPEIPAFEADNVWVRFKEQINAPNLKVKDLKSHPILDRSKMNDVSYKMLRLSGFKASHPESSVKIHKDLKVDFGESVPNDGVIRIGLESLDGHTEIDGVVDISSVGTTSNSAAISIGIKGSTTISKMSWNHPGEIWLLTTGGNFTLKDDAPNKIIGDISTRIWYQSGTTNLNFTGEDAGLVGGFRPQWDKHNDNFAIGYSRFNFNFKNGANWTWYGDGEMSGVRELSTP